MSAQIPGSLGKEGGNAWMLGRQTKSVHSSSKDHSRKHRRGNDVAREAKRWYSRQRRGSRCRQKLCFQAQLCPPLTAMSSLNLAMLTC